ncbi:MAG: DUF6383 domain-containing protein [bacterium]|nr:DUF6383 domain-containing protein [bacterium]
MKKLYSIVCAGLTVMSAMSVSAQTLTQDWKYTSDLPTIGDARYATAHDGVVYVSDKNARKLYAYDGTSRSVACSATGVAAPAITSDAAGNVIMSTAWWGNSMNNLQIWKKSTGEVSTLALTQTIKDIGGTSARMDFMGKAVGDIFSETGGAVFMCINESTSVVKIFIANGAVVAEKCKLIQNVGYTFDTTSFAVPLTDDPESDDIAVRLRSSKDFKYYNGTKWVAYKQVGTINQGVGGDFVTLNGTLYSIEPAGTNYADGFQIVDRSTNTVVATHAIEASVNSTTLGSSLIAEKVDECTARIYQYHAGAYVARYTFSLPHLYLVGNLTSIGDWSETHGLVVPQTADGVYEVDFDAQGGQQFKIAKQLGTWEIIDNNHYGFAVNGTVAKLYKPNTITDNSGTIMIGGTSKYHAVINTNDYTLTITDLNLPEKLYVVGNIDGHSWDPSYSGAVLNQVSPGLYESAEKVKFANSGYDCYFRLATVVGANSDDWTSNADSYGPYDVNTALTDGVADATCGKYAGEKNYTIAEGEYFVYVNANEGRILLSTEASSSVDKVSVSAVKAYGTKGEIRIIDGNNVTIYNAAGQALVVNSGEKTFSAPRGIYVVVVDGVAQKVAVK